MACSLDNEFIESLTFQPYSFIFLFIFFLISSLLYGITLLSPVLIFCQTCPTIPEYSWNDQIIKTYQNSEKRQIQYDVELN